MCTHISHIIDVNNDHRPSGVGPLGQNQTDAGAQPPPQSVHLQWGSQESLRGTRWASSGCPAEAHVQGLRTRQWSGGAVPACTRRMGGWALLPPTSSLSRPCPCAPWGRWAHRRWQDGRGMLATSRVLPSSVEDPQGSDPRFPPPPSGSSLRRFPGQCGCPGRLWQACKRSRPPGSRPGWRVRHPGPGGPPPASPGSG